MQRLLTAIIVKALLRPIGKSNSSLFPREIFWEHCLGTAIASYLLSRQKHPQYHYDFLSLGFLHDIGYLILDIALPDVLDDIFKLAQKNRSCLLDAEKKMMDGLSHMDIGKWLCLKWGLPRELTEVIANHHTVDLSAAENKPWAIIACGDIISLDYYQQKIQLREIPPQDYEKVLVHFNLTGLRLQNFIRDFKQKLKDFDYFVMEDLEKKIDFLKNQDSGL